MISMDLYKNYVGKKGKNLAQVRKTNSEMVLNASFTGDIGYKEVYILDPDKGWHWTDAKYSKHTTPSIVKDDVDYYLQFRPYEHHPIGTYVFIPNDTSPEIGFAVDNPRNPFNDNHFDQIFKDGKLWFIISRDDGAEFVKYMVLKCNWDFKWIAQYKGKDTLLHVYGANRIQSSYTSGIWNSDYAIQLDNVTACWLPDTYYIFGNDMTKYDLCDTRYLPYDTRFMLTTNVLDPLIYKLTKRNELANLGVIQCTLKQSEFDVKLDNPELLICNYYDEKGKERIVQDNVVAFDPTRKSDLYNGILNEDSELEQDTTALLSTDTVDLRTGKTSYIMVKFSDVDVKAVWQLEIIDDPADPISEDKQEYYRNLLNLTELDETTISIKPSKAKSLLGKKFKLTVQDKYGEYPSEVMLEVVR